MEANHPKGLLNRGREGCSSDSFSSVNSNKGLPNFAEKAVRLGASGSHSQLERRDKDAGLKTSREETLLLHIHYFCAMGL